MALTPKEKAEELFYKFKPLSKNSEPDYEKYFDIQTAINISNYPAKECALICVDFFENEFNEWHLNNCVGEDFDWKYWNEVRSEIEKL
jgi:hypothetical protein